jgi:hypothetical protein
MGNFARTPGRTGLKPRDKSRRVPVLEHYLRPWDGPVAASVKVSRALAAQPLPPAPGTVDRLSLVTDWPMYANGPDPAAPSYARNGLGDCFWAGSAHGFAAQRVYAGWPEPVFSDEAVITGYQSTGYVPGQAATDQGTDPAQGLAYLRDTGLTDQAGQVHKVAAYAAFADPTNLVLAAQCLAAFGTLGIAFACDQEFQDAFASGRPAQWVPRSPVEGGHWVVLQRRRVGGTGVLDWVTWGAVQKVTRAYHHHRVTDVFAIASADFIQANGVTMGGLDLEQLCEDTADAE